MSNKNKKVCMTVNYIEHFLILESTVIGCVSISAFASIVGIPIGLTSSAVGLKICEITAGIKNYRSIIKKNKNRNDKLVLLSKTKLNTIEFLITKALIDSYISHYKLVLVNNVLKKYDDMKKEIKKHRLQQLIKDFNLFVKRFYHIV